MQAEEKNMRISTITHLCGKHDDHRSVNVQEDQNQQSGWLCLGTHWGTRAGISSGTTLLRTGAIIRLWGPMFP